MKTAVVGSRSIQNADLIDRVLSGLYVSELISGGAQGVDTLAEAWARRNHIPVRIIKPNWARHGRAAGVIRNQTIIEAAELVVAIWDGVSPGTADSIRRAQALNRMVRIITPGCTDQLSLF